MTIDTEVISITEAYRIIVNQKVIDILNDLIENNFYIDIVLFPNKFFVTVPMANQTIISES